MKLKLVVIITLAFVIGTWWLVFQNKPGGFIPNLFPTGLNPVNEQVKPEGEAERLEQFTRLNPEETKTSDYVLLDVTFIAQAPTGNWSDARQQDGCEEAAVFMAVLWARGEKAPIDPKEKEKKLVEISDYELSKYGSFSDTSIADTVERIFKDYFKFDNAEAQYDIIIEDIKKELSDGNLVIVPVNGQKLGNPYYTGNGPERHNLIIRGYDNKKGEFITNDNGTRRGETYRYKEKVLFNAIRDYPTGNHLPIIENRTAMIVVKKPS